MCLWAVACASPWLLLPTAAHAKSHNKHHSNDGDGGGGGGEWVPPGDWPTAARLNAFLQTYLENAILAPLDSPVPPPRVALGALGIDFAAHLAAADSAEERALYAGANDLCAVLGRLLGDREQQQIAMLGIRTGGNASNPLDRPAYAVSGRYSWNLAAERARSQHREEIQARLKGLDRKNFFVVSKLRQWADRTAGYRQAVQNATITVNAAQIRADRARAATTRPAVVPNAAVPTVPGPMVPAVTPSSLIPPAASSPPPPMPAAADLGETLTRRQPRWSWQVSDWGPTSITFFNNNYASMEAPDRAAWNWLWWVSGTRQVTVRNGKGKEHTLVFDPEITRFADTTGWVHGEPAGTLPRP